MVNSVTSLGPAPALKAARTVGDMTAEHFLKLLITQLQNQDPFEPVKNQDLLEQISAVRQLESSMDLSKTLAGLAGQQQLSSAGGLIGKCIEGFNGLMERVWGRVTSVTLDGGNVYVELETGQRVAMKDVLRIWQPAEGSGPSA